MDRHPRRCSTPLQNGEMPLDTLPTDDFDIGFLTAARLFFVAFSGKDTGAWVHPILGAETFFPGTASTELMRATLSVVQRMRTSRRSIFSFSNPGCACCASVITQDERYLLQMVQAARAGNKTRVVSWAMLLCEGNEIDGVVEAARELAQHFPVATTAAAQA